MHETGAVDISAVVAADGSRHALLTMPRPVLEPTGDAPSPLLDEPIETSPAIVWLKDMGGRYLRVNARYVEQLRTDAERVCGKTDDDLARGESIEGFRLQGGDRGQTEPLELEYTIAAADGRPSYAVLRFALRDADGEPTAVCGVAAPLARADVARSECARLMRLERWSRVDEAASRAELFDEWGLAPANEVREVLRRSSDSDSHSADGGGDQFAAIAVELDAALATSARLERELTEERRQAVALREASILAARRAQELLRTVSTEQARSTELEEALSRAEASLADLASERDSEHSRADQVEAGAAEAVAQEHRISETLRAELAEARGQLNRLHAELSEAPTTDELESERASAHEATLALEEAKAELATITADLAKERRRAEQANAALAQARVRAEQAQAEKQSALAQAHAELRRTRADAAEAATTVLAERQMVVSLRAELAAVHEELVGSRTAAADMVGRHELEDQRTQAEQARADAQSALDQAHEELERRHAEAAALSTALAAESQTVEVLRGELSDVAEELARVKEAAVAAAGDAATLDELRRERARAEQAEAALTEQRERSEQSIATAEQAQLDASAAAAAVEEQRQIIDALRTELTEGREELEQLRRETSAGGSPVAGHDAPVEGPGVANGEPETAPAEEDGRRRPAWDAAAQRALSAALMDVSEWRMALRQAVNTIGSEGNWDAVVAWGTEERGTSMKCAAMWTGGDPSLSAFETRTWQHRQRALAAGRGSAGGGTAVTCVQDLPTAGDSLLRAAATDGMGSAVVVPISDGKEPIGMLQLLSVSTTPPNSELILSLEGIALQLGAIAQQLNPAKAAHWHFGRF